MTVTGPGVRIPNSPQPNEKPSLLGFFVSMQSQAPLERKHGNKKTKPRERFGFSFGQVALFLTYAVKNLFWTGVSLYIFAKLKNEKYPFL